jgi:hypothetical protein
MDSEARCPATVTGSNSLEFPSPEPAGPCPETRLAGHKPKGAINQTFPFQCSHDAASPDGRRRAASPRRRRLRAGQWELFIFFFNDTGSGQIAGIIHVAAAQAPRARVTADGRTARWPGRRAAGLGWSNHTNRGPSRSESWDKNVVPFKTVHYSTTFLSFFFGQRSHRGLFE